MRHSLIGPLAITAVLVTTARSSAEEVVVIPRGPADRAVADHVAAMVPGARTGEVDLPAGSLDGLVERVPAEADLAVVIDRGHATVYVVRRADGLVVARVLDAQLVRRSTYAVAFVATELLALARGAPAAGRRAGAVREPPTSADRHPAAPVRPPPEPPALRVAASMEGEFDGAIGGVTLAGVRAGAGMLFDLGSTGAFAGAGLRGSLAAEKSQELHLGGEGGASRSTSPSTTPTSRRSCTSGERAGRACATGAPAGRPSLPLGADIGQRHARLRYRRAGGAPVLAVGHRGAEVDVAGSLLVGVFHARALLEDGAGQPVGEHAGLSGWTGVGFGVRRHLGFGLFIAVGTELDWTPEPTRYLVRSRPIVDPGPVHFRGSLGVTWESGP